VPHPFSSFSYNPTDLVMNRCFAAAAKLLILPEKGKEKTLKNSHFQ